MDVSSLITADDFSCGLADGYDTVVVRAYHSYGGVDTNAPPTLENAQQAGLLVTDVYHFPCYGKDKTGELPAVQQVSDMVEYLASTNSTYGRLWFDVETNPSDGCGWETSSANFPLNCQFLGDLITAARDLNQTVGVYVSSYEWSIIMGSACTIASDTLLWYPHWDDNLSFSDFVPFGGWTEPTMKQYSDKEHICSLNEDADWWP
ncbi:Glycoside hydrolase, superfamily [Pelomyxa schiedti]|nr:Glycoside hydrolase, superfamily [Pelomyxa schiedti]